MFKKAERKQAKLKLSVVGPSGSGKTMGALKLAKGLGPKIALIDTENGSASLYADKFEFDTLEIDPPFTAQKYIDAIKSAEKAGYDVVIIDSLSHAWAGEGGSLDKKAAIDARGGNSYTNWATITKEHEALKSALLQSDIHLIATMRSKQEYVLEQNEKGKSAPKKVGMAPIQRDGMEYEFSVVFDVGMDHSFHVSKDRTGIFDGRIEKLDEKHGKELAVWLSGAKAPEVKPVAQPQSAQDEERSWGKHVVKIGKSPKENGIKGLTLEEIGYERAAEVARFLKQKAIDKDEPLNGEQEYFVMAVEKYGDELADQHFAKTGGVK